MNLRDSLLAALSTLPGTRHFHVHALVTAPRKHATLYPYATPRPRIYVQDYLVLLSEQPTLENPRVLVSAVEACLYHAPATSAVILYISKVDSTGQGISPSPTSSLVTAFARWHIDPATRPVPAQHLWLHLFARAQGQYLFPNSIEYEGKRALSDAKLCAWWRRLLGSVAGDVQGTLGPAGKVRLYYLLPGCNELEAHQALGLAYAPADAINAPAWNYGHPYLQTDIPLPCSPPEGHANLGHFIPSFDDDPKNRFMDEIALIGESDGVRSPARKRPRVARRTGPAEDSEAEGGHAGKDQAEVAEKEHEKSQKDSKDARPQGELSTVQPDEFWERMSFRQECVSGAVTGFFTAGFSSPSPPHSTPKPSPLAPQPGQVPTAMNKRILSSLMQGNEFSTVDRARKSTEVLEGAIRGLCEGLATHPPSSRGAVPTLHTQVEDGLLVPPRTPPRKPNTLPSLENISPNPFDEPEATLETYHAHIYGSVSVSNPPLASKNLSLGTTGDHPSDSTKAQKPKVNVLAVRKKKKRTETES